MTRFRLKYLLCFIKRQVVDNFSLKDVFGKHKKSGAYDMKKKYSFTTKVFLVLYIIVMLFSGCSYMGRNDADTSKSNTVSSTASGEVSLKYVTFDDIKPDYISSMDASWDAIGMDDNNRCYIGFTSVRVDGRQDFVLYRYDNKTGKKECLGSFIKVSTKCNNIREGEEIPKGHTKIINYGGKMYMGSMSFHDFKGEIDDLPNYRGSHIYTYDPKTDVFDDLSKNLVDGIVTPHEGIVAMTYMPGQDNLLIGLTHPLSNIVLFNTATNSVQKVIKGIPWELGNPLSREIVATKKGKIYTYRGTEAPKDRNVVHNMWVYDMNTDEMKETDYKITGGFWNGQAKTKDGNKIYLSTCNGELYVLDVETEVLTYLGTFLTKEEIDKGAKIGYLYGITLSNDEKTIYGIPCNQGNLYAYDIASGKVSFVKQIGKACYTGSDVKDQEGNMYFGNFGGFDKGLQFGGNCKLLVIKVNK